MPELPRSAVLVTNPNAGRSSRLLGVARDALTRQGVEIVDDIDVRELGRVLDWVARPAGERPLIVAAGGDGTVGAVVGCVADTGAVLGILPLGTSNDVARSLGVPGRIADAASLLVAGKVATVDVGRFAMPDGTGRYFVHAAAMGVDVEFSKLATRPTVRRRLGHLTYAVAGMLAMRRRHPFTCTLHLDGREQEVTVIHLSVVNAPIFGGWLRLALPGSDLDDRRLDVLAVEDMPLHRLVAAAVSVVLRRRLPRGLLLDHTGRLRVHTETPQGVILDGELAGNIPGDFSVAAEALRVVVPRTFVDAEGA
jgi:YegS/Rv2252/BmrU family lipid kinase